MLKNRLLYLLFLLLLVACGQADSSQGDHLNWQDGQGELPSRVGEEQEEGKFQHLDFKQAFQDQAYLAEMTPFNAPTGKWFMLDGEGEFGYGLTTGYQAPESAINIDLVNHQDDNISFGHNIRVRLEKVDQDFDTIELLIDETVYIDEVVEEESILDDHLPSEENVLYVLSAEVLNEAGEVEDTLLGLIVAVSDEMNVAMSLDQSHYNQDEEPTLTVKNYGPTQLMLGMHYAIEKKIDDEWKVVPLDLAFIEIAIILGPGDSHQQSIEIAELEPGEYRVIKDIQAETYQDIRATLAVEFIVD
ncbi:immunoglobulin-like domain-containing protein [Amphibacillus jilinensis]|uniref:immunoglobulin-like domain-containing protein n=1 Tax=Amphibacillus jilinensis TaxID=1216008 RepID=UPI00036534A9|nr:immunoglobulin-like domain-containing protein [Amphibacillus jilinensis]